MNQFCTSPLCKSGRLCRVCREPSSAMRATLAMYYALPDGNVNFDCPHGKPWRGMPPSARAVPFLGRSAPTSANVPPVPEWPALRASVAASWPAWLPEFDAAREALAGCTRCQDLARRRRWAERIAEVSNI